MDDDLSEVMAGFDANQRPLDHYVFNGNSFKFPDHEVALLEGGGIDLQKQIVKLQSEKDANITINTDMVKSQERLRLDIEFKQKQVEQLMQSIQFQEEEVGRFSQRRQTLAIDTENKDKQIRELLETVQAIKDKADEDAAKAQAKAQADKAKMVAVGLKRKRDEEEENEEEENEEHKRLEEQSLANFYKTDLRGDKLRSFISYKKSLNTAIDDSLELEASMIVENEVTTEEGGIQQVPEPTPAPMSTSLPAPMSTPTSLKPLPTRDEICNIIKSWSSEQLAYFVERYVEIL